jgi:hypothetical protein
MILTNSNLLDLDGDVILERGADDRPVPNAKPTTVGRCLRLLLLQPAPQGQTYTPDQSTERLMAAITCHQVADGGDFEIDDKLAKALRFDATRAFAPIISGQLAVILKGEASPIQAA